MRKIGAILAQILSDLKKITVIGIETWALEDEFIKMCKKYNVKPSCKNYAPHGLPPFPSGLCISLNEQAVHCFPKKGQKIKDGDLITIDTVIEQNGAFVDSAISFGVGKISNETQELIKITQEALYDAIENVKPGNKLGAVSHAIEKKAKSAGYSVLKDYAGHGIGYSMHEFPDIPCYGEPSEGITLLPGMTLAIETLICEKNNRLEHYNNWQTETMDKGNFAQFEHTVLVTKTGYEILTKIS